MNSSVRSTSVLRQSASFAGSDEDSSAVFRRWVSLCIRALMRDFISEVTLSRRSAACCFSGRRVETRRAVSSFSTTRATIPRTALVPRTSLVCPSNCGSARRTVTTAVRPARASSFSSLSLPTFRRRALSESWVRSTLSSACSNPARWVPPFGVAMMLTNEETLVS